MTMFPLIPGIEVNILLLVFLGITAGVISGFTGTGGGFLVTPALIILGFPAHFAVGTSLTWVIGNSIIGAFRHRRLGNIDMKLGMLMIIGTVSGVEVGVRILNKAKDMGLADEVVLSVSIAILLAVGIYILREACIRKKELDGMLELGLKFPLSMKIPRVAEKLKSINVPPIIHFPKSRLTISLWVILVVGFVTGVLAGIIGTGGGIITVPSLVYLIGQPSFMAVGTSIFQVIFPASFGSIRHTMSGNVIIIASFILLVSSSFGVQFGALTTRYVRGVSMRYVLAASILISVMGAILKLLDILTQLPGTGLRLASLAVTFGGMGIVVAIIIIIFITAMRYRMGKHIPIWVESLVVK